MTTLKHSESIVIARSPETPPYDLVSDITLMYGDMEPGVQSVLVGRGSWPRGGCMVHRAEWATRANLGDTIQGRCRRQGP